MVLRCRTILGSKRMEDSGNGKGSFFACYLLTSLNPRYKGCHYIGFTVNPRRRIRQHNGELTSGAWRTHRKRPWDMILCVYGFACQVLLFSHNFFVVFDVVLDMANSCTSAE